MAALLLSSRWVVTASALLLLLPSLVLGNKDKFEISYVMEPFETDMGGWFVKNSDDGDANSGKVYISSSEESLFGNASLRVDFQDTIDFGWTKNTSQAPHNCHGANYISLWYKLLPNASDITSLKLTLLDDFGYYDTYHPVTYNLDWQELRMVDPSVAINLTQLRGWQVELQSKNTNTTGTVLLDQLACMGGGELLGGAFRLGWSTTWEQAVRQGIWQQDYYLSNYSASQTQVRLGEGEADALSLDYVIEQTEAWGGYTSFQFVAPGAAYYNLSQATDLAFGYDIRQASTAPTRAHFRLILSESSDCTDTQDCEDNYERWYSFQYILDEPNGTHSTVVLPLEGSPDDAGFSFWLPGWAGGIGNRQFDKDHIKGFVLELSMDSQGEVGSITRGALDIYGMMAQANEEGDLAQDEDDGNFEISYVMEPFESIMDEDWFVQDNDNINNSNSSDILKLTLALEGALFGNASLRLEYHFEESATAQFGVLQPTVPHNCFGATHMSIWYRMLEPTMSESVPTLRLGLLDDDGEVTSLELEHFTVDLPEMIVDEEWHEFRIRMEEFQLYNQGIGGNGKLDLNRLRGWSIELAGSKTSGVLELDQVACIGGEDLFGSSFYTGLDSWDEAVEEEVWDEDFYQSEMSENETRIDLQHGIFNVDYTVHQVEAWGGYLALVNHPPGPAYFNLSQANYLNLRYRVRQPASVPARVHLRLILSDASDACSNCSGIAWEQWYNFNYVLDDNQTVAEIQTPLEGSTDPSSPFWLPGWEGVIGNQQFDKEYIKGIIIEFNVDSQGDIGSNVTGAIDLFGLTASKTKLEESPSEDASLFSYETVVEEPDLMFNTLSPNLRRWEFLGNQCIETCLSDATCLYALTFGAHCYTTSMLEPGDVSIANTVIDRRDSAAFWVDGSRRGDFCDLCECQHSKRTIDCRNRDLRTLPKTFELPWSPRVLDLRNNSKLVLLGSGALDEVADSLEELWLPKIMVYISPDVNNQLTKLSSMHWEGGTRPASNAISESTEAFSDVCCSRGKHMDLAAPAEGLSFCEMEVKKPGSDATFLPFVRMDDGASIISDITPSSDFMSEASESPEKCAEYCAISTECRYFSYDGRVKNAEHICYLQRDNGTQPLTVCCEDEHYANEAGTIPGWMSGLPPRTRNEMDNARVMAEPHNLVAGQSNGYETQYLLSLGSTPLRGAVWVEPRIASDSFAFDVSFQPARVVLYDSNATATVKVTVTVPTANQVTSLPSLIVHNKITSCDVAFMESSDDIIANRETTVFIDVILPEITKENSNVLAIVAVAVALSIALALALFFYHVNKRRQDDAVWKVKREELIFATPPEIVGRGSYGLVLKAEFRGTEVAVKRVIPSKRKNAGSMNDSSTGRNFDVKRLEDNSEGVNRKFSQNKSTTASLRRKTSGAGTSSIIMNRKPQGSRVWGLSPGSTDRAMWKKRKDNFITEMRHLSKLRHPCITTVMGAVISSKSEPMLVMELMHHGSLYDLLHNETMILEAEIILPILRDVSQGMRFLHSAVPQCVHGDLKSQNILVDRNFRAKVADFGLSERKENVAAGTPYWMAPELLRGQSCNNTAASDVFSFGIILYEVYSRKEPYEGEEAEEVLRLVADKKVNKRPEIPKDMPAMVQSFMTDCLVADPMQRPTFTELDQRLNRVDEKSLQTSARSSSKRSSVSLFDIFPKQVAEALRDGRKVEPLHRDLVTIFFSDIVGFTNISSTLEPQKVASLLGRLYSKLDALSDKHDIYKVETIGDAYMAVSNLVMDQPTDHVKRITEFAVEAIDEANTVQVDPDHPELGCVQIRVGFHVGSVVADVVGARNPRFCLFGDTVNTASRMESNGEKGRIHCSAASAELLEIQFPEMPLCSRGEIYVKGKGKMETYWVNEEGLRPSDKREQPKRASKTEHSLDMDHQSLQFSNSCILEESKSHFNDSDLNLSFAEEGQAQLDRFHN